MSHQQLKSRTRKDYPYSLEYRTRWSDNDMYDHMNNSIYNFLYDSIVNAYLIEHCGLHPPSSQQYGLVVHSRGDFFGSIAFPAVADLALRVNKLGKSSVAYEIALFERGVESVKSVGEITHVFVDRVTERQALVKGINQTLGERIEKPENRIMAPVYDGGDKVISPISDSGDSGDKVVIEQVDDNGKDMSTIEAPAIATTPSRVFEAPEFIRNMTPEQRLKVENSLRRKIDMRLMPMIVLMYIMNYLDRNNIAAAKLAGIVEDLNLKGAEFQTSVSILFVGYLLMQIPSNLFLNKIGKPGIYLPACMVVWGIISAATAACESYGGLIATRFTLGFVEAAYFPGCLFYLSCWYTRKELGFRTAIFYSGALISGAFSGLIAAGIKAHMDGTKGLRAWRWLFIIEGAATILIALASFLILPNFPKTTSWLTDEERELAVWRLEEDIGQEDWQDSQHQHFIQGLKLAFSDVKTYVLMVLLFGIVASGTVTNFFPTVVATLNYNTVNTLLLTAPPYVLAVITTFLNSWHAGKLPSPSPQQQKFTNHKLDRTGERFFHIVLPLCFAVFAYILAAATTKTGPRYVAMMLMVPGVYSGYVVALAWISNSLPRPPAKRAAALAFINAVSNCSSIYASYMYDTSMEGPRYLVAMIVNCLMAFMGMVAALTLRIILVRLNAKLDRGIFVEGAINNSGPTEAGKKGFRFRI
ncbi:hypothetical protein G7Y89_g8185 [Cudoniella acicularis]|uniref:Major facilitator superfamily (MFS) profile domain-containing protein n=1 Tax=Cudoniella acicularis TaxID=354080 RepID=A0A8H4RJK6_9HELO|nr:hypothetical protein G7Y89_g8185 [Cudoniella acicularis]